MVDNGDSALTSAKNRAFSVYSPLNVNLADSLSSNLETVPLVAMGGGLSLNYGVSRPTTFLDPRLLDNLALFKLGFDLQLTKELSLTFDYWYLKAMEKGVGKFQGVAKELSGDLGNETDLSLNYTLNDNIALSLLSGCFFPGSYHKEKRDAESNLFTPFVRGDGSMDSPWQLELILTITF